MKPVVLEKGQEQYWRRTRYLDGDHPVSQAFAQPKIAYIQRYMNLSSARILDVGCGKGIFTRPFATLAPFVVGVDTSEFMLKSNPHSNLLCCKAEALPFQSGAFDVAFLSNLLHHVNDPAPVVKELARVSRKYVVLIEPNCLNPLMFCFSLLVKEERGVQRSSKRFLIQLLEQERLKILRCCAMGMISQNNTPQFLIPLLKTFDREIGWGEYLVAIAQKSDGRPRD